MCAVFNNQFLNDPNSEGMFRIRNQDIVDVKSVFQEQLDISKQTCIHLLQQLYPGPSKNEGANGEYIHLSSNALLDAEWGRMLECLCGKTELIGTEQRIHAILGNPANLSYIHRTEMHSNIREDTGRGLKITKLVEKDILWVLQQRGKIDYPLDLLYPTLPVLKQINLSGPGLNALLMYKVAGSPVFQLAIPLVSIFTPYFVLRRQIGMNIQWKAYFRMIWLIGKMSFRQLRNRSMVKAGSSIVSALAYIVMYIYGLVSSIEYSVTTFRAVKALRARAKRLRAFFLSWKPSSMIHRGWMCRNSSADDLTLGSIYESARSDADMVFLYKLILHEHEPLAELLDRVYANDAVQSVIKTVREKGWCYATTSSSLGAPPIEMIGMGHPLLAAEARVRNGVRLDKNIVLTGPNAAGKSTYMRSVLLNTLLGVSLGICCAKKAVIGPVHAIYTQMRLGDAAGDRSLFEAEVRSCKNLLEGVHRGRPWSLIFMDEPMHSTNPLEGSSALKGLVERFGQMAGVRCMVTTHYHEVGDLDCIRALSMDAVPSIGGSGFQFPYKLKPGVSRQSIALELLRSAVDDPFIDMALVHKNASKMKNI